MSTVCHIIETLKVAFAGVAGPIGKVAARFPRLGHVDVWADYRPFSDRVADTHCGLNYAPARIIANHPTFATWLKKAKTEFEAVALSGQETETVVAVCKAGVNRSHAAAAVLVVNFGNLGYEVKAPRHLSKESWPRRGICSTCPEYSPRPR